MIVGDIDFDEPKTSRSMGYLNIASETSTEDEFAAEMSFHNNVGARSQPRLVYHVDNSEVHPKIVVDFRPIEPMPTSPSVKPKSRGKCIGISPSRSLDNLPKLSTKSNTFIEEARELYYNHFGAPQDSVLYSDYEFNEPTHHIHQHTDYGISAHEEYNKGSSFWKSYHAPQVMTATSQSRVRKDQFSGEREETGIDKDKYKLRPTLQTPPFPTDLTMNPKLAVYSGISRAETMEQDNIYDGASSSSVITHAHRDNKMQRTEQTQQQQQERPQSISSNKGGTEREQYKRHSRQSSHPSFGANIDIPEATADIRPDPPSYRQAFPDTQFHYQKVCSQQQQQQQKKDFSCCSLSRDPQKQQQQLQQPVPEDNVLDASVPATAPAPASPGRKRHSRHYRSNSTPFPSPCNFIDILADDPNTPKDPYNHYHVTTSQPSLANATSTDRISSHSVQEFSKISNNKVVSSSSAGNIPRGTDSSETDMKDESATLGKQPKKTRYIKHKSPSSHSFGALSGSSSSGTTLA